MRSIFATALISSLSQAVDVVLVNDNKVDTDYAYAEHMTKFGLSYNSVNEFETRKARFAYIDTYIRNHNSKEGVSYTLGHNKFSDWSDEERSSFVKGIKRREEGTLGDLPDDGTTMTFNTSDLPSGIDWLAKGNTTPIQDQKTCGSCWAFMTAGTVESAWNIMGGDLYNLSE